MSGLAPKLRFKQDDGSDFPEWEEKEFDAVLKSIPTKNHQIYATDINQSGKYAVIDQGKKFIAGYSNDETKLITKSGVIIFGDHTTELKFVDFNFIVGADGVKVLHSEQCIKYLYYFLAHNRVEPEGYKRHFSILRQLIISIPSLPEQRKIADFLSSIDAKIDAVKRKCDAFERYKKGLMQQIFSQKIRFKQDDGADFPEWEEKNIDYFFEVKSSKRVLQVEWKCSGIPFYRTRELVSLSNRQPLHNEIFISNNLYKDLASTYGVPSSGDFLVSGVGTLGIIYQVPPNNEFYFKDGNVLWFKKRNNCINSDFFKYAFQEDYIQNQIIAQTSTTTVGTYTIQNARVTKLLIPKSIVEQNKIAEIINSIDDKIDAIKTQVEKLEAFKKGLLQQMFI